MYAVWERDFARKLLRVLPEFDRKQLLQKMITNGYLLDLVHRALHNSCTDLDRLVCNQPTSEHNNS